VSNGTGFRLAPFISGADRAQILSTLLAIFKFELYSYTMDAAVALPGDEGNEMSRHDDMLVAFQAGQEYEGDTPHLACQDLNGKMPENCDQELQQEFMAGYESMNPLEYED
jgi:hypothetical protein